MRTRGKGLDRRTNAICAVVAMEMVERRELDSLLVANALVGFVGRDTSATEVQTLVADLLAARERYARARAFGDMAREELTGIERQLPRQWVMP